MAGQLHEHLDEWRNVIDSLSKTSPIPQNLFSWPSNGDFRFYGMLVTITVILHSSFVFWVLGSIGGFKD